MRKLIKDGEVVTDQWQYVALGEEVETAEIPEGPVVVPLPVWLAEKDTLLQRDTEVGVWLFGHEDPGQLQADIQQLPLIAVYFPAFTDGRGFSTGRLLRERYDFAGELRATGEFIRDQLCYLRRCGFNAFDLPERFDPHDSLESLHDFTEYYQSAVDQPAPLFRRRA